MNHDLPDVVKHRLNVLFKFALPFKSGNLRHNAATMQVMTPGARYVINTAEADYTETVFEYYVYKRGENFMYNAALDMYNFLRQYYNGGRPEWDRKYLQARRSVIFTSPDSEERQVQNILHGTGTFADDSLKAKILGGNFSG